MTNPQHKLNEAVAAAQEAVTEACKIADANGLSFNMFGQTYVGTDNGKRLSIEDYWDGKYYDELDEYAFESSPECEYSGWQNSSTFC